MKNMLSRISEKKTRFPFRAFTGCINGANEVSVVGVGRLGWIEGWRMTGSALQSLDVLIYVCVSKRCKIEREVRRERG